MHHSIRIIQIIYNRIVRAVEIPSGICSGAEHVVSVINRQAIPPFTSHGSVRMTDIDEYITFITDNGIISYSLNDWGRIHKNPE